MTKQYVIDQEKFGCRVGDVVRVSCSCESGAGGWDNTWERYMDDFIGKRFVVREILPYGIYFEGHRCGFPYFVLDIIR